MGEELTGFLPQTIREEPQEERMVVHPTGFLDFCLVNVFQLLQWAVFE